jgi:hypothetical protein
VALTSLFLMLSGCQSVETPQQSSLLRVIDASPNAPASDLVVGAEVEFENLSSPSISGYAPVDTGSNTLTLRPTGTTTGGVSSLLQAVAGQEYSYLLLDQGTGYTTTLLMDQSVSAPAGDVSLRFITDTPVAGALDVYLVPSGGLIADATPVEASLTSGSVTAYVNVPAGTYDLVATAAGGTVAKLDDAGLTFSSGQVRTLVFTDQPYTKPAAVNVAVGDDLN